MVAGRPKEVELEVELVELDWLEVVVRLAGVDFLRTGSPLDVIEGLVNDDDELVVWTGLITCTRDGLMTGRCWLVTTWLSPLGLVLVSRSEV